MIGGVGYIPALKNEFLSLLYYKGKKVNKFWPNLAFKSESIQDWESINTSSSYSIIEGTGCYLVSTIQSSYASSVRTVFNAVGESDSEYIAEYRVKPGSTSTIILGVWTGRVFLDAFINIGEMTVIADNTINGVSIFSDGDWRIVKIKFTIDDPMSSPYSYVGPTKDGADRYNMTISGNNIYVQRALIKLSDALGKYSKTESEAGGFL